MTGFGWEDNDDFVMKQIAGNVNALPTEKDVRDLDAIEKRFNDQFTIHDILIRNGWYPLDNSRTPYKLHYIYSEYQSDEDGERTRTIIIRGNDGDIHISGGGLEDCNTAFGCYQVLEFDPDDELSAFDWEDDLRNNAAFIREQDLLRVQEICTKYNLILPTNLNQSTPL